MAKKINYFIMVLSIFIYSCSNNKIESNMTTILPKKEDHFVIFYELPKDVMSQINSEMKDHDIVYALISISEDEEITDLLFKYSEKSERINSLVKKSNRKMILNGQEIPILFSADFLYSTEPDDTIDWIQDFDFATFKFNNDGRIIEKIKF